MFFSLLPLFMPGLLLPGQLLPLRSATTGLLLPGQLLPLRSATTGLLLPLARLAVLPLSPFLYAAMRAAAVCRHDSRRWQLMSVRSSEAELFLRNILALYEIHNLPVHDCCRFQPQKMT
jgi:hypothetical protein